VAADALAHALRDLLASDPAAQRLEVQVFERDGAHRLMLAEALSRVGFVRAPEDNDYTRTLSLDLSGAEADVFARLDRSARRNVRELAKHPVTLAPITDLALAPRLDALHEETVARTGGHGAPPDWREPILLSRELPSRSRFVGIFANEGHGAERLLAFAWGQHHGDRVEYSHGGSTRHTSHRMALAYPLIWDLIAWAHAQRATWFDMGGVTLGSHTDAGDPLGGISDFKRFFTRDLVEVAEDWVLYSSSPVARLATLARRVLAR
jgi:hypothetical protein